MIKVSFSTLACPSWTLSQVLAIAQREAYDGVELRFLRGEDSLWKLSEFQKSQIADTRRTIADSGLRISCLDTSCRFDSPRLADRQAWVSEGVRMAELAQEIGAPGIRVFGDRVPPESDREMTRPGSLIPCIVSPGKPTSRGSRYGWKHTVIFVVRLTCNLYLRRAPKLLLCGTLCRHSSKLVKNPNKMACRSTPRFATFILRMSAM